LPALSSLVEPSSVPVLQFKIESVSISGHNAFPESDGVEARKELEAGKIIGFSESLQINKALSVVRAFLKKLDEWEREHQAA
jgi:hypothetical protein